MKTRTLMPLDATPVAAVKARPGSIRSKGSNPTSQHVSASLHIHETREKHVRVRASIDVGYGNWLFIRGEGAGLSWEAGKPLTCVDANTWEWSTLQANLPTRFKLLLNDKIWAQGEDLVADPGRTVVVAPRF